MRDPNPSSMDARNPFDDPNDDDGGASTPAASSVNKGKGRALPRNDTDLSEMMAQIEIEDRLQPIEALDGSGNSSKARAVHTTLAPPIDTSSAAHSIADDSDLHHISYETKRIHFGGSRVRIVCQTTNGACPIISIVNFLVLTSALDLPDRERIGARSLTEVLTEYILTRSADVSVLQELNGLHRGLAVDPRFYSIDAVQDDGSIMAAFGCMLVHTWIPPPDDPAHALLNARFDSFDKAQMQVLCNGDDETSLLLQNFFDTYPTNTTPYGVQTLRAAMRESEMRVLFLNSHFSLVYKHPVSGDLYTLVTDSGYISSGDDVVWESLDPEPGRSGQLYSADFIPRTVLGEGKREDAFGQAVPRDGGGGNAYTHSDELLARDLQQEENAFARRFERPFTDEEYARQLQRGEERWAEAVDSGRSRSRKSNSTRNEQTTSGDAARPKESAVKTLGSRLKGLFGSRSTA